MPAPLIKFGLDVNKAPRHVVASLEPIIRFFSYHDAHPVALGLVCIEKFGFDWIDWEPETLKQEILSTFKVAAVSTHNWQKIQAFRAILLSASPWEDYDSFENVILALNNVIPNPEVLQQCSLAQLFAGVDIMSQIREEPFSPDVCGYMASVALAEGVTWLPTTMGCANTYLAEPTYRCLDCGNEDSYDGAIVEDGRCDVCCERFTAGREFDGKPREGIPDTCGKNLQLFYQRDSAGVPERFEEWKDLEEVDADEENPVDVQAAKLVIAHKYRLLRRSQLVEQLEELKSWVTH